MSDDSLEKKQDHKIDYEALEQQRTDALQSQVTGQLRAREVGKSTSLKRVVLRYVSDGKYKDAVELIDEYMRLKEDFPALVEAADCHVVHSKELINAIRAKRNFPNLSHLPMPKQQEILDNAVAHFEELRRTLQVIEGMVKSHAVADMRTTVWVVRSLVYVVATIFGVVFISEFSGSLGKPFWFVFKDFASGAFGFLEGLF